ncbi:glycosyltransferase family 9 protein [Granulicella sibirica]|uniref:ADP-heptose--lipooligosaccharide heptosyltransferase II n=1 Tax=Granulicella sibirica TaxID=2479048 RepID=A0A4Q0T4X0_9BACT|nr:glycosyltransferase family 9 protein [Granulicella sibirica]RXH58407.1 ADP-heptose--lipooligosaccharide heptosyltransferase II [Granulicella sibirica]
MATNAKQKPERVLIYRLGSLGDTLVALPALHLVARAFPDAERRMLTSIPPNAKAPAASAILDGTGLIHGYLQYPYATRNPFLLLRLWWNLLRWRPGLLVYMNGSRAVALAKRDERFFRLCGVRNLVGVPITEDMVCTRSLGASPAEPDAGEMFEHESSRLARNLSEIGDARLADPASWDLHLTEKEQKRASQVLEPLGRRGFLSVSFGTKNQSNDWEQHNWKALLERLADLYPNLALVICGAAVEAEMSEFAASGWRARSVNPVLNLCGQLSPRESAAVMGRSVLYLGHDSGPTHLAAAVQTTCVAIYGGRNLPGIWFPYGDQHKVFYHRVSCSGCRLQTCTVEKKRCVLSITVDEVLGEVTKRLPPSL